MEYEITTALIGAGSALLGATVGGVSSYFANKSVKVIEWKQSIIKEEIDEKKKLYSGFLAEANRLVLTAIKQKTGDISEFEKMGNYISQIQLFSNKDVITVAKDIADHALACHMINEPEQKSSLPALRTRFAKAVNLEINNIIKAYKAFKTRTYLSWASYFKVCSFV